MFLYASAIKIKNKNKKKEKCGSCLEDYGGSVFPDMDKAEVLNALFVSVFASVTLTKLQKESRI